MFQNRDLQGLLRVFDIDNKKELVKYCKDLVIYSDDFASLILAYEVADLGYRHKAHYRDIVPKHLWPSEEEHAALRKAKVGPLEGKALRFMRKTYQTFEERRSLIGHIFFAPSLRFWHFFYFDQRDRSDRSNHWRSGPHVHFINYLWPNYTMPSLWEQFISGYPRLGGSVHIRYIDDN